MTDTQAGADAPNSQVCPIELEAVISVSICYINRTVKYLQNGNETPTQFVALFVIAMEEDSPSLKHPLRNTAFREVYKERKSLLQHYAWYILWLSIKHYHFERTVTGEIQELSTMRFSVRKQVFIQMENKKHWYCSG